MGMMLCCMAMVLGGMLMGDHSISMVPMTMVQRSCRVVLLSGMSVCGRCIRMLT